LSIGVYYPSFGKSNQEIAALSRSRHQSQGFGSTGTRGEEQEYLEFLKGDALQDKTNLFEGIDTSWNRVKGGKAVGDLLSNVEKISISKIRRPAFPIWSKRIRWF